MRKVDVIQTLLNRKYDEIHLKNLCSVKDEESLNAAFSIKLRYYQPEQSVGAVGAKYSTASPEFARELRVRLGLGA